MSCLTPPYLPDTGPDEPCLYVLCWVIYVLWLYVSWLYVLCRAIRVLCCMFYDGCFVFHDCMFHDCMFYDGCFMMGGLCFMIVCFMMGVLWWVACVGWLYVYQTLDLTGHGCMLYVLWWVFHDCMFHDCVIVCLCVFWWPFSRAPDLLVFTWVEFWGPKMGYLTPPRPHHIYQTLDLTSHVCMFYVGWFMFYDCMFCVGWFVFHVGCFMIVWIVCFVFHDCMFCVSWLYVLCWVVCVVWIVCFMIVWIVCFMLGGFYTVCGKCVFFGGPFLEPPTSLFLREWHFEGLKWAI